jgi:two-component system sensor histidine kinase BaeS
MPSRLFRTLTARAALITCAVAMISVTVTAAIGVPVAVRNSDRQARLALANEADLVAELLRPRVRTGNEDGVVNQLRRRNIDMYLVRSGQPDRDGLPQPVVDAVTRSQRISNWSAVVAGRASMVEGRPLGVGNGVVLVRSLKTGIAGDVLPQLWLPLLAGLAAGLIAGSLLARRLARPIRNAAAAATRLSAGDRTVRVPVESPAEAEDLAHALNGLAAALATSEGRQRDFLLSISHELRTPLTTIKGYAEALADGVVGADGAPRAGRTLLDEAERLDRLVSDLLVLARLEADDFPLELMAVDLAALVSSTAEAWTARCGNVGVQLKTELPMWPVQVRTDPGRVRQVLDGLLENALRAVPTGAPLVLAVRSGGVFEIRDGGPGFTDEDLAVAFERGALYQRYRGVRSVGSGLGLALASRLVRRLGGTIEAGHASEGGARFTVQLPTA